MKALSSMYDKYTVDEWMEQHIDPLMNMLTGLMQRAQTLTDRDIWPRRPLNFKKLSSSAKIASASAAKYQDRNQEPKVRYRKLDNDENEDHPRQFGERKRKAFVKGAHGDKKPRHKVHTWVKLQEKGNQEEIAIHSDVANGSKENNNAPLQPSDS